MINRKYFSWEITKVLVVNQATMGLSFFSWQIANAIRLALIYKEKLCSSLAENPKLWFRNAAYTEGVYVSVVYTKGVYVSVVYTVGMYVSVVYTEGTYVNAVYIRGMYVSAVYIEDMYVQKAKSYWLVSLCYSLAFTQ